MKVSTTFVDGLPVHNIPTAVRKPRVTVADAQDPQKLADLLTGLRESQDEVTRTFRSSPLASCIVFQDVAITYNTSLSFHHGFARRARWLVVDWVPAISYSGYPPYIQNGTASASTSDTNTLTLTSYVTGVISLLVF